MTYFTADLHLGHANIITMCDRPFADVEEMDGTLVENWNSRVLKGDDVWIVGDLSFRGDRAVAEILPKLKGRKHLILGNHDKSWMKKHSEAARFFESIEQMGKISVDGNKIFMCHYPMMEWDGYYHGSYLVYGHIHNAIGQPFWNLIVNNNHMLNAGVDVNGYHPVTFGELVENNRIFKEGSPEI